MGSGLICLDREEKENEGGLGVLRSYNMGLIETNKKIFLPMCVYCCF
jgi:CO dehydrogenase/acetyl-CoA synthase alpha subunit